VEEQNGTRQIIGAALTQLKAREQKLDDVATRTTSERTEARVFIKAIEKALGGKPDPAPSREVREPNPGASGENSPRGKFTQRILTLLEDNHRSIQSIADHFGSSCAYVAQIVTAAESRGLLSLRDGVVHVVGGAR
jgi:hypothetical protein